MLINERIRELMNRANISQKELATRSKLSQPYISELLRGNKTPSIGGLCSICGALGVSMSDFFSAGEPSLPQYVARLMDACKGLTQEQISALETVAALFISQNHSNR